ncbi:MAG: LysR substrate-binding domain-containing protein [Pseudomonadota bacterium]
MTKLWQQLGSPRNLIIFEAAARLGTFTRAAEELSMRQPSVSAAVKQLEEALGAVLFTRHHRHVTLTEAGERLFGVTTRALSELQDAVTEIGATKGDPYVTFNASSAFTTYWMVPRLQAFRAALPDIDLRMQSTLHDPDLGSAGIDLGVRLGSGDWPDCHSYRIADEVIYPVAIPRVFAAARNLRSIPNLMNEKLIHLEEPMRQRPSWPDWFAHHSVRDARFSGGLRLNDYALVLQAAIAGDGIAFGWDHIVRQMVDSHLLAAKEDWAWRTGNGIFLIWPRARALSPQAEQVRDWIMGICP